MLKPLSALSLALLMLTGCQSVPNASSNGDSVRVNNVTWQKSGSTYQAVAPENIPANQSNVVFIRPVTNTYDQSSANISLNDHYLVSLQAGHYTQSFVCSGNALISVLPTGEKSNDLKAEGKLVDLKPQQTYYFAVDVEKDTNRPKLVQITPESAQQLLDSKAYQTHQISRVINDCTTPIKVIEQPVEVVEPTPAPVAPVNIRLNVLFDHDQSVVKAPYQEELARLAKFLNDNQDIDVVIEGHTDATGDAAYNQRLSQRRAEAVKNVLVQNHGVNAARLSTVGYGESRPVASNDTAIGRQENRRVIVVVTH